MSNYTVKQIANMLKTNEDTVRRWISMGKLAATKSSKKSGYVITSEALNAFIKNTPKYAPMVIDSVSKSPMAVPIILGGLLGGLIGLLDDITEPVITEADIKKHIEKKIKVSRENINKKTQALKKLQREIELEKKSLEKYQYALENIDLSQMAEEINKGK